jgi:hypothetical protein
MLRKWYIPVATLALVGGSMLAATGVALHLGYSVLKLLGGPRRVQQLDRRTDWQRGRLFGLYSCLLCLVGNVSRTFA